MLAGVVGWCWQTKLPRVMRDGAGGAGRSAAVIDQVWVLFQRVVPWALLVAAAAQPDSSTRAVPPALLCLPGAKASSQSRGGEARRGMGWVVQWAEGALVFCRVIGLLSAVAGEVPSSALCCSSRPPEARCCAQEAALPGRTADRQAPHTSSQQHSSQQH